LVKIEVVCLPGWTWLQVNKYAFSGGRQTVEEHRKLGADLEVGNCASCDVLAITGV
jgi:hypothetical protein